jgi:ABC-type amino acid transport substrate-binding protein
VVISALYADPTRVGPFAYSVPYFDAGQVLVVAGETEEVRSLEDLEGLVLAVELGSEGDAVARAWSRRLTALRVLSCPSADEALAQAASGEGDAALVDHLSALAWSGEGGGLRIVGEPVTEVPYAVAVRQESRGLLRAINEVLTEMEADGSLDRLRQHWFVPAR